MKSFLMYVIIIFFVGGIWFVSRSMTRHVPATSKNSTIIPVELTALNQNTSDRINSTSSTQPQDRMVNVPRELWKPTESAFINRDQSNGLSLEQQIERVVGLQGSPELSREIIIELIAIVGILGEDETLRNHAANIILAQLKPNLDISKVLLHAIDDKNESNDWKDYAIQHVARCVALETDFHRRWLILDKLYEVAKSSNGGLAGTALLHIHRLTTQGESRHDDSQFYAFVRSVPIDRSLDLTLRMTAIGIIGEARDEDAIPMLRVLICDEEPSIRRTSLASLSFFRKPEDLEVIRAATSDEDASVVASAIAASKLYDEPF